MKKLMVIIPDVLSDIITKGEVIDRYYNPGNYFSEVHLVLTNSDKPDLALVQKMVGTARLFIYNTFSDKLLFLLSCGWNPWLMRLCLRNTIQLLQAIEPQMIRCHGASVNVFMASCIKDNCGIPYVVSMHINPDVDIRGRAAGFVKNVVNNARKKVERIGLLNADLVMPVYSPIVSYLEGLGVTQYKICYNVINPKYLCIKKDYSIGDNVKVISVGRQFAEKNPINLIRAVARIRNIYLTLVGDGPYHQYLVDVVEECGVQDRVFFHKAIPNDELCAMLPNFDIFSTHTEYFEISKSVLEPLLTGLPVLLNRRIGEAVKELTSDKCLLVPNTVEAYFSGLNDLIENKSLRESMGKAAFSFGQANWLPANTEQKFVSIYMNIIKKAADVK